MHIENISAVVLPDVFTERLRVAVRTSRFRAYTLAHLAGVHHSTLSAWINGIRRIPLDDPRVARLCVHLAVSLSESPSTYSSRRNASRGVA